MIFNCVKFLIRAVRFKPLRPVSFATQFTQLIPHQNVPSLQYFTKRKYPKSRFFIYGGILSYLGIAEKEKEDPVIQTIKLGILSMQREEFQKAEQYLHLALKMAQERSDSQAIVYIYDILANVAFQKGDFKNAETLFIEVMKHLISMGTEENDNSIVEISLKMAAMYSKQGLGEKAEAGYQFCLNSQQEKIDLIDLKDLSKLSATEKETLLLWAMCIDWYARHLLDKGKLIEAQTNFERAYIMSEKINGPSHHQTLVLMNDIGSVATLREDYNTALNFLQAAIDRGKTSYSPDLPSFYCNLGVTYMKKGDNTAAYSSCSQALQIAEKLKHQASIIEAKGCLDELHKLGYRRLNS